MEPFGGDHFLVARRARSGPLKPARGVADPLELGGLRLAHYLERYCIISDAQF